MYILINILQTYVENPSSVASVYRVDLFVTLFVHK